MFGCHVNRGPLSCLQCLHSLIPPSPLALQGSTQECKHNSLLTIFIAYLAFEKTTCTILQNDIKCWKFFIQPINLKCSCWKKNMVSKDRTAVIRSLYDSVSTCQWLPCTEGLVYMYISMLLLIKIGLPSSGKQVF